jgi:Domain of unknown function (DUF4399)
MMIGYLYYLTGFYFSVTQGLAYYMIFIEFIQPSKIIHMKKMFSIPAILFMGLVSCNSGSNESTPSVTDSVVKSSDSMSMAPDSSHAAMSAATAVDMLPAIPDGAKVSFKNLKEGQTVSSPVKVEMGATKIAVDSASKGVKPASGHFHLLIDAGDSTATGVVVPKDSTHLHFGNAQKEAMVTLTPGKHRLAIQFADGMHRSYGNKLATAITVDVKK